MEALQGFFSSKRGIRQGDPISPLLFVLCMEYFSRTMTFIGKLPGFQFHPRCKSMALNHLAFVDDVILFCKGDFQSVQLMLQGIQLFAATSGLKANPQKSDFFIVVGCLSRRIEESWKVLGSNMEGYLSDIWVSQLAQLS